MWTFISNVWKYLKTIGRVSKMYLRNSFVGGIPPTPTADGLAGVWRLKCFLGPLTFCIHRLKCFWGPSTFYIHRLKCFAEYLVRRMNGIKVLTYPLHVWWWWWRLYPQFGWVSGEKRTQNGGSFPLQKNRCKFTHICKIVSRNNGWVGGGVSGFSGSKDAVLSFSWKFIQIGGYRHP